MKLKLFVFASIFMILLGSVSAVEWNDKLTYSKNDLKISLDNWWGLGKTIGTAELKSHESVDHWKPVGVGESVVMWYDLNFSEYYSNGLGEVDFINLKTGEKINRNYGWVVWKNVSIAEIVYSESCGTEKNGTYFCEKIDTGKIEIKEKERWIDYGFGNDIPKGNIRIGIKTFIEPNDLIDIVWTIGGKKIKKHAIVFALLDLQDQDNTGAVITALEGIRINVTTDTSIVNVTIHSSPNSAAKIHLYLATGSAAGNIIATADVSGRTATFPANATVNTSNEYFILANSGGSSYQRTYYTAGAPQWWPVTNGVIDGIKSVSLGVGEFDDWVPNIRTIYTSGGNNVEVVSLFPENLATFTTTNIYFVANITDADADGITNVTLLLNGTVNETNSSTFTGTYNFSVAVPNSFWNYTFEVYDDLTNRFVSTNGTLNFTIDSTPTINVFSPTNNTFVDPTIFFNATNSTPVETWIVNYNGTNHTLSAINTSLEVEVGFHHLLLYANDTSGGVFGLNDTIFFSVQAAIVNSDLFNASTAETANESFVTNITTNGTAVTQSWLYYDGSTHLGAVTNTAGNDYNLSASINIPLGVGNKTFAFNYTLGGANLTTNINEQNVSLTDFALCNATFTEAFLNITFKNETTSLENVNATISSTWTYSLGNISAINKTLIFSNATENFNYTFCANPVNRSFVVETALTYTNSISQQRGFLSSYVLTNSTTTQVLYLLPSVLGLFSPFQVIDFVGDPINSVLGAITRVIAGETIAITSGTTDDSGFITYFLDPDQSYTGTFSKSGFTTQAFTFVPSTTTRIVTMGGGAGNLSNGTQIFSNTTYFITPENTTLFNDTIYNFGLNVTSSQSITFIGFEIRNKTGFPFLIVNDTGAGFISGNLNTSSNKSFIGYYTIQTADETITVSRLWIIGNEFAGDYSIFTQTTIFLDYEFEDAIRYLIVLLSLIATLIFIGHKEVTDTSESKILVFTLLIWGFSFVGWLDTGLIVNSSQSGIQRLGQFSNQFGIAILSSVFAAYFVLRRLFIRRI